MTIKKYLLSIRFVYHEYNFLHLNIIHQRITRMMQYILEQVDIYQFLSSQHFQRKSDVFTIN